MSKPTIHIITTPEDTATHNDRASWVENFLAFLRIVLEQMDGADSVAIQIHDAEISPTQISITDVVIAIVSPSFINALSRVQLIEGFLEAHTQKLPAPQVFKVMKAPISQYDMPPQLRKLLAYNFFYIDASSGVIKEYEQFEQVESENAFWLTLVDLVYDIQQNTYGKPHALGKGRFIYLAEVGADLHNSRQLVKRELKRFGYRILPDSNLPQDQEAIEEHVMDDLKQCAFSIHLIGSDRGEMFGNTDTSLPELQNEITAQFAEASKKADKSFSRLIWINPNLQVSNEKQKIFVNTLQQQATKQENSEIIQMKLEDFKSVVLRQLAIQAKQIANLANQSNKPTEAHSTKARIYLITDRRDYQASKPLAEWLQDNGFQLLRPDNTERSTDRQTHIKYLNECDASIVFYENAKTAWLITKLQDILKSPGLGREKPLGLNTIFTTTAQNKQQVEEIKEKYMQYDSIQLIYKEAGFPQEVLAEFFGGLGRKELTV